MSIDSEGNQNDPSYQFNQIAGNHIGKGHKEPQTVSFMSHPDNDNTVQEIINYITKSGGVREVWQPITLGIVTNVDQEHLSKLMKQKLNEEYDTQQIVKYVSTNGHTFTIHWTNLKPQRTDVDYKDFPMGFKVHDCIRVTTNGALITSVKRASLSDIKATLTTRK